MVQLIKLLEILTQAEIEFVLVGGAAAYAHGSSMMTQDLDVCGCLSKQNIERLAKALAPHNPKHRISKEQPAFTAEQADKQVFKNIYLTTDIGQIDFLGEIKGLGNYDTVKEASQTLSMGNFSFQILSIGKLIEAKEAMGRPRDLETVSILKSILDEPK
ncbi:MAG: nucleotidyltransferase [Lentimonas sp.]